MLQQLLSDVHFVVRFDLSNCVNQPSYSLSTPPPYQIIVHADLHRRLHLLAASVAREANDRLASTVLLLL